MLFRVQRISILEVLEIANIRVHHIARIVYRHSKLQFGNSTHTHSRQKSEKKVQDALFASKAKINVF